MNDRGRAQALPQKKKRGEKTMKYEITFNPVRKLYCIWACGTHGAELVKTFKTENAAKRWIASKG
jgi:hypothetical protein